MNAARLRFTLASSLAGLALMMLACSGQEGVTELPELSLKSVTPERISREGGALTVRGENFFEVLTGAGFEGELAASVCGVPLTDVRVEGEVRTITAAPGQRVEARLGDTLSGTLPPVTAPATGDVVVSLPDGRSATATGVIDCYDPTPEIISFELEPNPLQGGETATFSWTVSSPDDRPLSCSLLPGDGSQPTETEDCQTTGSAEHTYMLAGETTAVLTVSDDAGRVTTRELSFMVGNAPPVARFTVSAESGTAPLTVSFDAAASSAPNGEIVSYAWDFGDGHSGAGRTVEHTFARGSFAVTLTVTDNDGEKHSSQAAIDVLNAPPIAGSDAFTFSVADLPVRIPIAALLANDSDPDGDELSVVRVQPARSVYLDSPQSSVVYDPGGAFEHLAGGESGTDTFSYVVEDGFGGMAEGTVSITVTGLDRVLSVQITGGDHHMLEPELWVEPDSHIFRAIVRKTGELDREVTWSSSDEAVATIDHLSGEATPVSAGETEITATSVADPSISDSIRFTVGPALTLEIDTRLGEGNLFVLPLYGRGTVTIFWGDGTSEEVRDPDGPEHEYPIEGKHTLHVVGNFMGTLRFNATSRNNAAFLTAVTSWGDLEFHSLRGAFKSAVSLTEVPRTLPQGVIDTSAMFRGASKFNGDIGRWDTSQVTNMREMFKQARRFNQDLNQWDTSRVHDMAEMFASTDVFNGNIGSWDTRSVYTMSGMFSNSTAFNKDIGAWDTGNVVNMSNMFSNANVFNKDIGDWDTSQVTSMQDMFNGAEEFSQDISGWNTSSVTSMDRMFWTARAFNKDLSGWCVENIPEAPTNFSMGANLGWEQLPNWGAPCDP